MTPMIWGNEMVGTMVKSPMGETLGTINDFVFDPSLTEVRYAVVASGDFLGIGGKLFAVPLQSMVLDTENECFILDIDRGRLEDGPSYDQDDRAGAQNPAYRDAVFRHYGIEGDRRQ
jgi:hypothetical protein